MKTLTLEINIPNSTFPSAHSFLSAATDGFIEGLNSIFVGAALNYYSVQNAFDEEDEMDAFSAFLAPDAVDPAVEEAVAHEDTFPETFVRFNEAGEAVHDITKSWGYEDLSEAVRIWKAVNGLGEGVGDFDLVLVDSDAR